MGVYLNKYNFETFRTIRTRCTLKRSFLNVGSNKRLPIHKIKPNNSNALAANFCTVKTRK